MLVPVMRYKRSALSAVLALATVLPFQRYTVGSDVGSLAQWVGARWAVRGMRVPMMNQTYVPLASACATATD